MQMELPLILKTALIYQIDLLVNCVFIEGLNKVRVWSLLCSTAGLRMGKGRNNELAGGL